MVFTLAGCPVIPAAGLEPSAMKRLHSSVIPSLKGQVHDRGPFGRCINPQFVYGEKRRAFANPVVLTDCRKDSFIKPLTCLEIFGAQVNVVNQSAAMKLHNDASSKRIF